jgi:hypothetical protein
MNRFSFLTVMVIKKSIRVTFSNWIEAIQKANKETNKQKQTKNKPKKTSKTYKPTL